MSVLFLFVELFLFSLFFFFSSRRRHTRSLRDWSSDVCSSDLFETSLMMAAAPEMVREKTRISLPPIDGLMPALKKGAKTFTEAGGEDAYFGDPTAASAEEGETLFDALSEILTLSVMEHLGSKA